MVEHLSFQSLYIFSTAVHTVWCQKAFACSLALLNSKADGTSPAKIMYLLFNEGDDSMFRVFSSFFITPE